MTHNFYLSEERLDSYLTERHEHDMIHSVNKRRAEIESAYEHGYIKQLTKEYYVGRED